MNEFLDCGLRTGGGLEQLADALSHGRVERVLAHDVVNQADGLGAAGVKALAGQEQLAGRAGADLGQYEGRDDGRGDAQPRLAKGEHRPLDGHNDVAAANKSCAAADGRAVDAADDRPRAAIDGQHQVEDGPTVGHVLVEGVVGCGAHRRQVGPGAEGTAAAGQHHGAHVVARRQIVKDVGQRGDDGRVHGVVEIGPVERHG